MKYILPLYLRMDERAAIPVTLPRDNPTPSYWQDPPDEIADLRSTDVLPEEADVVIVGSGITGAAVAWNLLENDPERTIVMLEARKACSGATGRNGRYKHKRVMKSRPHPPPAFYPSTPFALKDRSL